MRNTYYDPANLQATADWALGKLAFGNCSAWERILGDILSLVWMQGAKFALEDVQKTLSGEGS